MTPLPVVLCGQREQIAAGVIENLKPEFEVIHLILNPAAGNIQIPQLLAGQSAPSDTALGTKNYTAPPVAVFLGAGYEDDEVAAMMKSAAANGEAKRVPWLRPDTSKPAPPLGPEYGKALVERIKVKMGEIEKDKQMNEANVQWY